ncbi:beta-galactosidase [Dactylosporangium maewongense]|uniref:Beta-galactosidase n=1 Tax=Dactylosporangium maewongense TaxID=634393 RepID=A0ABN2B889_9ACTN
MSGTFTVTGRRFVRNGARHRILAGAAHYFRTHPAQWTHRLRMLRAMGLNTVETYVPWNWHEPRPGTVRRLEDLERFLDESAACGLDVIVRPGPYICAEWDNGGLPAWLTARVGRRVRTADPDYLRHVDAWFDRLLPVVARRQITRGGTVVMVQVENEYGSFGSDAAYLRHLADGLTARGIEVPLCTSDGPEDHMLTGGSVPGVLTTVNFGSDPEGAFAALAAWRPQDPPMCMEFWDGWFDHWGDRHVARDPADAAGVLDRILAAGASVNLYMAHGGTNFGTTAGANLGGEHHDGAYQPTTTSYDYDAPIDERGAPTAKFWRFREVIERHGGVPGDLPPLPPLLPAARLAVADTVTWRAALPSGGGAVAPVPPTFEELGLDHGLVLYRCTLPGPREARPLVVDGLHDRAHVFVDGRPVAVLERDGRRSVDVAGPATVELLVESMGRVNYGPRLGESKGILGGVRHERQYVHGFTAHPLALDPLDVRWTGAAAPGDGPAFCRAWLDVEDAADTYVALPGWGKGYVWVNGVNLGRFWDRGPQRTLYLPGPLLHAGRNEVVVLELDGRRAATVDLVPGPQLG